MLKIISGISVIAVLALFCVPNAWAQSGKEDYLHYCAPCHGQNGTGKGDWNGTEIPDLTLLRRHNGGKFPSEDVRKVVDGRNHPVWHQRTRDMPYWGSIFQQEESDPASKAKVDVRIAAIVEYIRGFQK